MVISNVTPGQVRITHENSKARIILRPMGHERSVVVVSDAEWQDSDALEKMKRRGLVKVESGNVKPSLAPTPTAFSELGRDQKTIVNGLVLGTDAEYEMFMAFLPYDNRADMSPQINMRYVKEKLIPAFKLANEWLHEQGNKKRERGTSDRIKELEKMAQESK